MSHRRRCRTPVPTRSRTISRASTSTLTAIRTSMGPAGTCAMPSVASDRVMLCPTVNAVIVAGPSVEHPTGSRGSTSAPGRRIADVRHVTSNRPAAVSRRSNSAGASGHRGEVEGPA
jgi:hypothetical protein